MTGAKLGRGAGAWVQSTSKQTQTAKRITVAENHLDTASSTPWRSYPNVGFDIKSMLTFTQHYIARVRPKKNTVLFPAWPKLGQTQAGFGAIVGRAWSKYGRFGAKFGQGC